MVVVTDYQSGKFLVKSKDGDIIGQDDRRFPGALLQASESKSTSLELELMAFLESTKTRELPLNAAELTIWIPETIDRINKMIMSSSPVRLSAEQVDWLIARVENRLHITIDTDIRAELVAEFAENALSDLVENSFGIPQGDLDRKEVIKKRVHQEAGLLYNALPLYTRWKIRAGQREPQS